MSFFQTRFPSISKQCTIPGVNMIHTCSPSVTGEADAELLLSMKPLEFPPSSFCFHFKSPSVPTQSKTRSLPSTEATKILSSQTIGDYPPGPGISKRQSRFFSFSELGKFVSLLMLSRWTPRHWGQLSPERFWQINNNGSANTNNLFMFVPVKSDDLLASV